MRLGLCCTFLEEPDLRFRTTTARYERTLAPRARRDHLRALCLHNGRTLGAAVEWCARHRVGAFRVNSGVLPLYTHPQVGYRLDELDRDGAIRAAFLDAGARARRGGVRLSFHPDQFVVPGSPNEPSVVASLAELDYQAMVAGLIGAEQLTIHGGGRQGGTDAALERLRRGLDRLSARARTLVALENDDRLFSVQDLLPVCRELGVPLVYDLHHHRCLPDEIPPEEAVELAARTWGEREPWGHISSPAGGWGASDPRLHARLIDPRDVPRDWPGRRMTVDVEAKDKELAVLRLRRWLDRQERRRA